MGVQIPQKGFFDDVALEDDYQHELDLLIVTQMSRSIETPIVGLSDVFGVMPIENAIETNPSIPKARLLDERIDLIQLLKAYLDVLSWSYEDMPRLDPSIIQHCLPLLPHDKLIKEKLKRLHPQWSLQMKKEIQKQLNIRFLSMAEYPQWLANVILIPKKDGRVRVCVNF
ncbi:hypothetical protein CK203_111944 [Vitis vinifera]|uniref:Uncharacterized protein n=1 Tax=Vitis vinifera TaxID=29760 RepID=A0A438D097_VITVI|nr:hypothetical protein CK203_111944 [Vitis vinifera]